jgi:hypothetical protein
MRQSFEHKGHEVEIKQDGGYRMFDVSIDGKYRYWVTDINRANALAKEDIDAEEAAAMKACGPKFVDNSSWTVSRNSRP